MEASGLAIFFQVLAVYFREVAKNWLWFVLPWRKTFVNIFFLM